MENSRNSNPNKDSENNQNPANHSDIKEAHLKLNQIESKYDSHSEKKPHQKTIISTDAKPDRVSNDNRDNTQGKIPENVDEDSAQNDEENLSKPFPKSRSSSFPSLL